MEPYKELVITATASVTFLCFIHTSTLIGDYQLRQKVKAEMTKLKTFLSLTWAWIPENIYRIAAVHWRTSGQDYHGAHRLEDKRAAFEH